MIENTTSGCVNGVRAWLTTLTITLFPLTLNRRAAIMQPVTMEGARVKQGSARLAGAREFYKLFVSAATPYVKRRFALAVVIAVAVSLLAGVGPLALKWIVDSFDPVIAPRSQSVAWLVVAYVGVHWLNRVMGGMQAYLHAQADRRMYRALSDRLFDHVLRLPLRFHLERHGSPRRRPGSRSRSCFQPLPPRGPRSATASGWASSGFAPLVLARGGRPC